MINYVYESWSSAWPDILDDDPEFSKVLLDWLFERYLHGMTEK